MELKDRIKLLRDTLDLTQTEFADKVGIKQNTLANYESGRRIPMESTIKSICREYNVDYFWLTEGKGEMFTNIPNTLLEELCKTYDLDLFWVDVLKKFLDLSDSERTIIKTYLIKLFNIKDD